MFCFALLSLALMGPAAADKPRPYAPPRLYGAPSYGPCEPGLVRRADGACVEPVVTRNLFLYTAPPQRVTYLPPRYVPDPKVHVNYVFVRTAGAVVEPRPLVVAPPKQKTLVYLLNKNLEAVEREVIQVEAENEEPDVYFVNYNEGENPELPGGVDLETALRQSESRAEVIDVGSAEQGGYQEETLVPGSNHEALANEKKSEEGPSEGGENLEGGTSEGEGSKARESFNRGVKRYQYPPPLPGTQRLSY